MNFKLAIRSLFKKGNRNLTKILSLGTGLAIGIVLIAKVSFELSYNKFYTESDRIYSIHTGTMRDGAEDSYPSISGAISQGFKDFVPGVEESTRVTFVFDSDNFITEQQKNISGKNIAVDTNFFKIFDRPILIGKPSEVLSKWGYVMVSRSFAEKLGPLDSVVGKTIRNDQLRPVSFTIGGIFEDFPENGYFDEDVLISMSTLSKNTTENWMGNDRYSGWVKLAPGVDYKSLSDGIRKMQEAKQPIVEYEANNGSLWYYLEPFRTEHVKKPQIKSMIILLSFVAFALIFTSIMNYILLVISSLVRKSKEIGVRKCYGAEGHNIRGLMMADTLIHLLCSLMISVLVIYAFRGMIESLVGASISSLFSLNTLLILVAVIIPVFLISALTPSYIFSKIPVSTVFRNYKESKRRWKLALLLFQFTITAFMVTLLVLIGLQYNKMTTDNPGYDYENLIGCDIQGIEHTKIQQVINSLKSNAYVDMVEVAATTPLSQSSGNNIFLPGSKEELFNIADQYGATEGFFKMMNFKVLEGKAPETKSEVAVSRHFAEKIITYTDWKDGVIGKSIIVSEHSRSANDIFTICGVYEDYRMGRIGNEDTRPSIRFYDELGENCFYLRFLFVKINNFDNESLAEISKIIKESFPEKEIEILVYQEELRNLYDSSKKMRNSVMIGGIITLIIALIGLIGYINDETNRRSAEIAIRKINGAIVPEILRIFSLDILKVAIPALIIGNIVSFFVASRWLEQFSEKIALSWWIFFLSSAVLLIIILASVVINCLKIANSNPIESLKNE